MCNLGTQKLRSKSPNALDTLDIAQTAIQDFYYVKCQLFYAVELIVESQYRYFQNQYMDEFAKKLTSAFRDMTDTDIEASIGYEAGYFQKLNDDFDRMKEEYEKLIDVQNKLSLFVTKQKFQNPTIRKDSKKKKKKTAAENAQEKADAEEAEKKEAERKEAERKEAEKKEAEKKEAEKKKAEKKEADEAEKKKEAEKKEEAKKEEAKKKAEKKQAEKKKAEKKEAEKKEAEKKEAEKKEAEKKRAEKKMTKEL